MGDETDRQRHLARAIREAVDASTLKPAEIASTLSVSEKTVYRWMNGEAVPDALQLRPLADRLGVSPMLFVDPPVPPTYPLAEYLVRTATDEGVDEGVQRARRSRQQRPAS